jgi:hypothetical protein
MPFSEADVEPYVEKELKDCLVWRFTLWATQIVAAFT